MLSASLVSSHQNGGRKVREAFLLIKKTLNFKSFQLETTLLTPLKHPQINSSTQF
jgi:hypothetical protein